MRSIVSLYGKPLGDASEEDVRRGLKVAQSALNDMRGFDPEIERNWVDTITSLNAELVRRGLPVPN